jgi:hypothetical protein
MDTCVGVCHAPYRNTTNSNTGPWVFFGNKPSPLRQILRDLLTILYVTVVYHPSPYRRQRDVYSGYITQTTIVSPRWIKTQGVDHHTRTGHTVRDSH